MSIAPTTRLRVSPAFVKIRGGGYQLMIEDAEKLAALMQPEDDTSMRSLPSTPEGRVNYLLSDLLSRSHMDHHRRSGEHPLCIPQRITNDLKRVEEELGRFGLTLERRPHYGIRVSGPEMARRLCVANLALDQLLGSNTASNRAMLDAVSRCVNDAINAESFQINSAAYQNLVVHIAVAVTAHQGGLSCPMDSEQLEQLRNTRCFEVAEKIATSVEREFEIDLPLKRWATFPSTWPASARWYESSSDDDAGLVISDEVWDVVSEMLEWCGAHTTLTCVTILSCA